MDIHSTFVYYERRVINSKKIIVKVRKTHVSSSKRTIFFSVIVSLSVVFAVGSVGNQKVLAANLCGSGFCDLIHFFGGDVVWLAPFA